MSLAVPRVFTRIKNFNCELIKTGITKDVLSLSSEVSPIKFHRGTLSQRTLSGPALVFHPDAIAATLSRERVLDSASGVSRGEKNATEITRDTDVREGTAVNVTGFPATETKFHIAKRPEMIVTSGEFV